MAKITNTEKNKLLIKNYNDRPNALATYGRSKLTGQEVKDIFDKQFEFLVDKHNEHDEEITALETKHDEEIAALVTKHNEEIAALETKHDKKIAALEDKHDDELAEVNGKIKALCGASGEVTLAADDWGDDLAVTLAVAELGEQDMIVFDPVSAADRELICDHEVFISAKAQAGAVSVSARTKPSKDIALCYFIIRGGV